jgi:NAD(P)-dependent dehydrogenase (short-subunit alcohol dehydrogenase family)
MSKIIITGASRGIGYQLVRLLVEEGHEVLALSRSRLPGGALREETFSSFSFDLGEVADFDKLREFLEKHWKSVDILVNNAGAMITKPFQETTREDFRKVYEVNVFGLAEITRTVLPYMKKSGHVVNISSMGGVKGSTKFPGLSAYRSSKGAVITLTELLAEEFKEKGPSFNALALGAVQTEMLEEAFPGYKAPVKPEEMAEYIKDFCLKGHRFCNGKVLQLSSSTP